VYQPIPLLDNQSRGVYVRHTFSKNQRDQESANRGFQGAQARQRAPGAIALALTPNQVEGSYMERLVRCFLTVSCCLAFTCAVVWAQGTAQISGTVSDPSGARLPGVEVSATQTATGQVRSVVSNESGFYVLPSLPTGPYRLSAGLPGFRMFLQTGIILEVSTNPVINITMEVGQVTETVEVQANAALVETRNVGVGQIMETKQILELPLNGRNVTDLITLSGAATTPADGSSSRSISGQQNIRVAGGISGSVHFSLDGALHTNPYDNLSLPLPFPDALQEFKVETSALTAAQGGASGAQASAVTKSGTNEYHGDLFEFVRNDLFNATPYFGVIDSQGNKKHSTLKRNQFGGILGGPIVKNKVFFFGGYQGTTLRADPADNQAFVPTTAMMAGDFSKITDASCGRAVTLRTTDAVDGSVTGFNNNHIDPALFNPVAVNLVKKLPQAQNDCGLVIYGSPTNQNEKQLVAKTDWQASSKHSIMGRFLYTSLDKPVPYTLSPNNVLTVATGGRTEGTSSYSAGDTWLVSSSTVVSTRLAASYTAVRRIGANMFNMADLGVKGMYTGYQPNYSTTNVTNGFALGGGTENDSNIRTFSTSLNSDVSLTLGNHQFGIGGSMMFWDSNSLGNVFSMGVFTFNGTRTGLGLADFLLGRLTTFRQASPNFNRVKKYLPALYISDSWKATRRVTLSYGLRWEPDLPEILKVGSVQNYSEARRAAGIQSTIYKNAPLGFYYPGDPGYPGKRGRESNLGVFAPRLGFAWDARGDGKTSVRGSAGIAYDYLNIQAHLWTSISPPFNYDVTVNNPKYDDPWGSYPGGSPFPASYNTDAKFTTFGGFTVMPYHLDPSQTQSWNLAVQHELGGNIVVSASYLGNHVVHMLMTAPLNPAIFVPGVSDTNGNCFINSYSFRTLNGAGVPTGNLACSTTSNTDTRRVLSSLDFQKTGQFVGALAEYQSVGKSSYNGMLLDLRKRTSKGLTLSANYTWSHCLASDEDTLNGNLYDSLNTYIYVNDRDRGITNCTSDRRHVVNLSGVAQMPKFANERLRKFASGWQLAPIYRIQSGSPLSVIAGPGVDSARNGTAAASQPADQVSANAYGDTSGLPFTYWLNRDAFAAPAVGRLGNMKPRTVVGPKLWSFDMALSRTFQFKEAQRLEVRAEAYNVTNSFRPQNPSTAQNNQFFGQIRTARDARIMQFALKYAF
jgi:hypothetical protein